MFFQSKVIVTNIEVNFKNILLFKEIKENISNLSSLDILSISLDEKKKSIGIDELKRLSSWAFLKKESLESFVVFNAEKLTKEASNSLLKILEEPAANSEIVLICNQNNLLPTILSRCKIYNFNLLSFTNDLTANFLDYSHFFDAIKHLENKEVLEYKSLNSEIFHNFSKKYILDKNITDEFMLKLFEDILNMDLNILNKKQLLETLILLKFL